MSFWDLLGAGLNIGGGFISAQAAKKAAKTQVQAQQEASAVSGQASAAAIAEQRRASEAAIAQQQRAMEQAIGLQRESSQASRDSFRPYAELGDYAAGELGGRLNNNALLAPFNPEDLYNDPGYQFQLAEGNKAIDHAAGARGKRYSGETLKALTRFGQDYAGNAYQNAFSRDAAAKQQQYNFLAGPANLGMGISGTLANLNANTAGNIGRYGTDAASNIGNLQTGSASNIGNIGTRGAQIAGQYIDNAGDARAEGGVAAMNALTGGATNAYEGWRLANDPKYQAAYNAKNYNPYGQLYPRSR